MTKSELRNKLKNGEVLDQLFHWRNGQDCIIFKSNNFIPDDEIIYIPDINLNELKMDVSPNDEEIEDILNCCYTGFDFIAECGGDFDKAEFLWDYCDWQHPSAAYPEIEWDDDELSYPDYILQKLRMSRDLDEYDNSHDDYFNGLSHDRVFQEICEWEGLLGGWDKRIRGWIEDIYGIKLS